MSQSNAFASFQGNLGDVERLAELHLQIGGDGPGRRHGVEVLHKSAIVLLTATWEAYCEDLVSEVIEHYVTHLEDPANLPGALRTTIAGELSSDKMKMWLLAGENWRSFLMTRLEDLKEQRDRKLNTPKTSQIKALFNDHLGITDISAKWGYRGSNAAASSRRLDDLVTLRGSIAHRVAPEETVTKDVVTRYTEFVRKIVTLTDRYVVNQAEDISGHAIVSA